MIRGKPFSIVLRSSLLLFLFAAGYLAARQLIVVQEKAPMFKEPSISSPIIKYLEKESRINLLAVEDSFYLVSYGGYEGWVIPYSVRDESGEEIKKEPPAKQKPAPETPEPDTDRNFPPGRYLIVTNNWANVREGPGLNYKVIGKVHKGDRLEKFIKRGSWYRVRLPDATIGFIREDLVADFQADSQAPSTDISGELTDGNNLAEKAQTIEERVNRLEKEVAELRKIIRETQALILQQESSRGLPDIQGILPGSSLPGTSLDNIRSRAGEKIIIGNTATKFYHLPNSKFYDKIPEEFRTYFTSEEQAKKAGYSKSIN